MEVGTLLVFAICACVVAGVLRQYSPGFAIVFSLGCACLLLLRGLALARPVFDFLNQLNSQLNGDALACVWKAVSYTHLRAHETGRNLVCRLLLEKKKKKTIKTTSLLSVRKNKNDTG